LNSIANEIFAADQQATKTIDHREILSLPLIVVRT